MRIRELAEITGGSLCCGNPEAEFHGAVTDSRQITGGELFVALPGETGDGHDYAAAALAAGAAAVMVSRRVVPEKSGVVLLVKDALAALQTAALHRRRQWRGHLVGVTGSVGKTSTREICATLLSQEMKVLRSRRNYNNEIGVPLTLLGLEESDEVAIVEMGMRAPGEIAALARLCRPDTGIITCIGESHIEMLGSVSNIARAKAELLEALPADGTAILPADDVCYDMLRGAFSGNRSFSFGLGEAADVRAEDLRPAAEDGREGCGTRFRLLCGGSAVEAYLPLPGRHSVVNALAAVATALSLGMSPEACARGLSLCSGCDMRLEMLDAPGGIRVISDVYNASPASVRAALEVLAARGGRRIAVLADMLELGNLSADYHAGIGAFAAGRGIEHLFLYGNDACHIARGALDAGMAQEQVLLFNDRSDLADSLLNMLCEGDTVLVKGSRGMAMENVVKALLTHRKTGGCS